MTITRTTATGPAASTPPAARPRRPRRRGNAAGTYLLLMTLAILFAGPFAWLVLAALKTKAEWVSIPAKILPETPRWGNFVAALTEINFPAYLGNSLFLSFLFATIVTFSSAAVGFGFARLRGRGKRPLFEASPFLVFLFRQFFAAIPAELEDAAIIDGCGYGRIFLRIFLPLSRPVLWTSFLLSFTWTWGDYIAPALFLDPDQTTLSVAIAAFYLDPHGNPDATVQAAAATLYVVPVLVIFLFAQRYFIRGVVSSGLKG